MAILEFYHERSNPGCHPRRQRVPCERKPKETLLGDLFKTNYPKGALPGELLPGRSVPREMQSKGTILEQCSDVWALSRSKPTFLWKDQFELICQARLQKKNRFNSCMTKSLRKKMLTQNLVFCGSYFLWPLWNWGFGTNMESNAAVSLQFEHLAVTN